MPWNGVKTRVEGEPVLAADENTYYNDNLLYLLAPNSFEVVENSGTYTTTSATLVDVHANYSKNIVTFSGYLTIYVTVDISTSVPGTGNCVIVVDVDGTDYIIHSSTGGYEGSWLRRIELAAGAHTVKLQFRNDGVRTTTIDKTWTPLIFGAVDR